MMPLNSLHPVQPGFVRLVALARSMGPVNGEPCWRFSFDVPACSDWEDDWKVAEYLMLSVDEGSELLNLRFYDEAFESNPLLAAD